ncbi:hypothetical protein O181_050603 [Austropuccinia psidii MF-1]|uniref:Tc1-like transposase DDE domain-containing protein n=1 Tax=Austropuccinia psidii MF-1 TaxID=1389203 RepID=A0A9Q3DZF9_9BASI|nr:hypothetical protein [Austropuccinia psidii MF-1]
MEGGAPIHSALISTEWRANNNIQKLVWLANSFNLNPIENLWFKMKYTVTTLYNPRTMDELQEAICMAWDSIPVSHLDALLASMPHRMQAVIHNNGAPVRWALYSEQRQQLQYAAHEARGNPTALHQRGYPERLDQSHLCPHKQDAGRLYD